MIIKMWLKITTLAPYLPYQAEQMKTKEDDYSFRLEYTNHDGMREKIYTAITYAPATQIMSGNWKFETLNEKREIIAERIRPLKMRQTCLGIEKVRVLSPDCQQWVESDG